MVVWIYFIHCCKDLSGRWFYGQRILQSCLMDIEKIPLGICDWDHTLLPYIVIDVHQYPLPSILSRSAEHINYCKWLCSSDHRRSNQRYDSIMNNKDKIKMYQPPSSRYPETWISFYTAFWLKRSALAVTYMFIKFPDFPLTFHELVKIPAPCQNTLTFRWLLISLEFSWLFPDCGHPVENCLCKEHWVWYIKRKTKIRDMDDCLEKITFQIIWWINMKLYTLCISFMIIFFNISNFLNIVDDLLHDPWFTWFTTPHHIQWIMYFYIWYTLKLTHWPLGNLNDIFGT